METNKIIAGILIGLVILGLGVFAFNANSDAKAAEVKAAEITKTLEDTKTAQEAQDLKTREALDTLLTKVSSLERKSVESEKKADELNASLAAKQAESAAAQVELALLKEKLKTEGVSTVAGEIIDNLYLNDAVNFIVDEEDVPELIDGTIEFDGTDYDVHEEVSTVPGKLVLGTSLTEDDEFSGDARLMVTDRKAIVYTYVFDEPIEVSDISNDEALKISLLGQPIEIVKLTPSQATIRSGNAQTLFEGEEVTVDGKKVKLVLVGEGAAYVSVDGSTKVIKEYRSEKLGGLDVRVEDILTNEDGAGMATLVVGTDTIYTQNNNDDFFDNELFTYTMDVVGGELRSISVSFDEKLDKATGERAALKAGEEVCFPNKFVCVKFEGLENADYVEYAVTFDEFDEELENGLDVNTECVVIETAETRNIEVGTTEEVSELYACVNNKVYFQDTDGDWFEAPLTAAKLVNDDATYTLAMGPNSSLQIVEPTGDFIQLDTDFSEERFGALDDEAESTDVKYNSMLLGNREYDVLTLFGTVLVDVESGLDSEEFTFKIPSDRVEANVLVYSQ